MAEWRDHLVGLAFQALEQPPGPLHLLRHPCKAYLKGKPSTELGRLEELLGIKMTPEPRLFQPNKVFQIFIRIPPITAAFAESAAVAADGPNRAETSGRHGFVVLMLRSPLS